MVRNEHFLLIAIFVKSKLENMMVNWEKLNRNYVKSPIIFTLYYFNFIETVACWTFNVHYYNENKQKMAMPGCCIEPCTSQKVSQWLRLRETLTRLLTYINVNIDYLKEKKYNMILYIICVCVTYLRTAYMPHRRLATQKPRYANRMLFETNTIYL